MGKTIKLKLRWILTSILIILILTTGFGLSISAYVITTRAIVIGLSEYHDQTWGKIHGDKDVPLVKGMLTSCVYKDVTRLDNKEATKAGILTAFRNLSI